MKVELHLHTSRYSACAACKPEEILEWAQRDGYQCVYITEHDAIWTPLELADMRARFPALRIFGGVELSLHGAHLLVLGATDPWYTQTKDTAEILARARSDGHLTVLAHPFRWDGGDWPLQKGLLPDALELRTNNQDARAGKKARQAAKRLHLPLVNCGDTHSRSMLGKFWIQTDDDLEAAADIRRIILEGRYRNVAAEGDNDEQ